VGSVGSGEGPVAGCCACGDEPSGSCDTELVVSQCVSLDTETQIVHLLTAVVVDHVL
jgi:hypothetical protein